MTKRLLPGFTLIKAGRLELVQWRSSFDKVQPLRGFTLIELLVVLTIIAILFSAGMALYTVVNQKSRDAARLAELSILQQAIFSATHETENSALELCFNTTTPCQGVSFPLDTSTQKADGSGWIKVDFDSKNIVNLPKLPLDPTNNANYYYRYYSNGTAWKIETALESAQYQEKMQTDGGTDPQKYEVGLKIGSL